MVVVREAYTVVLLALGCSTPFMFSDRAEVRQEHALTLLLTGAVFLQACWELRMCEQEVHLPAGLWSQCTLTDVRKDRSADSSETFQHEISTRDC